MASRVHFVASNTTLVFVYMRRWDAVALPSLIHTLHARATDVLVYSVGVFYNGDLSLHKQHMTEMVAWTQTSRYPGTLFLRELSPTHFSGDDAGLYQNITGAVCTPFDAASGYRWIGRDLSYILQRCRNGMPVGATMTRGQLSGCNRIFVIPVFDISQTQYDAHFGSFSRKVDAARADNDCVHWCLPSAAVDSWGDVLFHPLQR
jgi:hypothetical protein